MKPTNRAIDIDLWELVKNIIVYYQIYKFIKNWFKPQKKEIEHGSFNGNDVY